MNIEQKQAGWSFWIWWTGVTIIGGVAGTTVADKLSLGMLSGQNDAGILFSMLGSGVFALFVSAAQWILLRRLFSNSAWWLAGGTFGRAFGMLIGSITIVLISHQFNLQGGVWTSSIYLAVRGAVLGISQWLILKKWRVKSGWWVLGNAIAWMLGSTLLDLFIAPSAIKSPIIRDLIEVTIAGAVTGAAMVWILRQPTPAPMNETEDNRTIIQSISVWAISWGVSWAVGWSIIREIIASGYIIESGKLGGMIAGGLAGLIGGVGTAIVLKQVKPTIELKRHHLIILALGWAGIVFYDWLDGFVITGLPVNQNKYGIVIAALSSNHIQYGIGGPLSGLVGGLLTALILLWAFRSLDWKQYLLIVIGWGVGFSIGGWVVWTIGFQIALKYAYGPIYGNDPGISSLILFTLVSLLGGAFAGWSGGAATLKQFSIKPSQQWNEKISSVKKSRKKKIKVAVTSQ